MKSLITLATCAIFLLAPSCSIPKTDTDTDIDTDVIDYITNADFIDEFENTFNDSLSIKTESICNDIAFPRYLKDLNLNDVYSSNINLSVDASLKAYGFEGSMGKKDLLTVAYFTKYKDFKCGDQTKRAMVGVKLYVHASQLKTKISSPNLPIIAAAVELGLAKAEYRFQTFGVNPENFYQKLPSAQFTVDTYSKVISAYDNIVHSLNDSTAIDPLITDVP